MSELKEKVIEWMVKLKLDWESHNIDGVVCLFDKIDENFEGPFSAPVSSREDIKNLWEETKYQSIEKLDIDLISFEDGKCAMHWYLKYQDTRDDNVYEMDGTYEVHFNLAGECKYFKQWWVMAY